MLANFSPPLCEYTRILYALDRRCRPQCSVQVCRRCHHSILICESIAVQYLVNSTFGCPHSWAYTHNAIDRITAHNFHGWRFIDIRLYEQMELSELLDGTDSDMCVCACAIVAQCGWFLLSAKWIALVFVRTHLRRDCWGKKKWKKKNERVPWFDLYSIFQWDDGAGVHALHEAI